MSNVKQRTLLVHAGGSKTGSTAIQNFCELHADRLLGAGVYYGRRLGIGSKYQMGSGNGFPLYQALASGQLNDVMELTQSHSAQGRLCLCSSEYFAHASVDQWALLKKCCDQSGLELRVIIYVRNVIPFLQSAYDQAIKRHGESACFAAWSENAAWQHAQALQALASVFDPQAITVAHYDTSSATLIRSFFGFIGIASALEIGVDDESRTVNRSLTSTERAALRRINGVLGDMVSPELSDHLIYQRPELKIQAEAIDLPTIDRLVARFGPDVQWINQVFFAGRQQLAVLPHSEPSGAAVPDAVGPDFELERTCLIDIADWCVSKLKGARDGGIDFVANRLRNIDWHNGGHSLVPADFDPVAYLLFNPDVLVAGAPPYEHFILAGHQEGRRYTWPKS